MKKLFPLLLVASALLAGGCAPKNWDYEEDGAFDPFEGFNRSAFKFNKRLDSVVLKPLAQEYNEMPAGFRGGVRNFLNNLREPGNIVNNTLQKQGTGTLNSTARLVFNTVLGVGGIFDVASKMGLEHRPTGFAETMRGYGLTDTVHFHWPVAGPTTFGDGFGTSMDSLFRPRAFAKSDDVRTGSVVAGGLQTRADLQETMDLIEATSVDEYASVRDFYEGNKRNLTPARVWGSR